MAFVRIANRSLVAESGTDTKWAGSSIHAHNAPATLSEDITASQTFPAFGQQASLAVKVTAVLSETLPFPQEDVELSSQVVLAFGRPITVLADGFLVDQTAVVLSGSVNGVMLMEEFIRCLQAAPTDTVPPDGSPVGDYEVINGTDDGLYFSNGVKTYVETLF